MSIMPLSSASLKKLSLEPWSGRLNEPVNGPEILKPSVLEKVSSVERILRSLKFSVILVVPIPSVIDSPDAESSFFLKKLYIRLIL